MKEAIPVKAKHIKHGVMVSACECPIALAIRDVIEYRESSVGSCVMHLRRNASDHNGQEFMVLWSLQRWIEYFDRYGIGDPFILILDHKAKTASKMEEA